MKYACILFLSLALSVTGYSQNLKKLGKWVKDDVEWRAKRRAGQAIDKGLDSLFEAPKKSRDRKATKEEEPPPGKEHNKPDTGTSPANTPKLPGNNIIATAAIEEAFQTSDGHISLKLSADKIFTGGSILISGESIRYKNFNQVGIVVTGPSPMDVRRVTLTNDNKYTAEWVASEKTGEYTVTVTSSDQKAKQSATFTVEELEIEYADDWPEANIKETKKALDNLVEAADRVKGEISTKNKADLEAKIEKVKSEVADVLQLFKDLGKANKEMVQLAKQNGKLPSNLAANLSALNNNLAEQANGMKTINEMANRKPLDNSVCEYLVILNEACAAFSTLTNVWTKSIGTIIQNIAIDKVVPNTVSKINTEAGGVPAPYDFPLKEATKIYATSKFDAKSLTEKLGKAGIAGDVIQFATEVLMDVYCDVFKGRFTHDYTIDFRNSKGITWWRYGVKMKAAFTLRYPKTNNASNIIKMKGNLEGNGTEFSFFADVDKEDGFQEGSKGKIEVVPIKAFVPLSVSFATSERDILGFGAIARGLATPAYFNIPIDAEYDVDAGKIKLFVNEALVDFSPFIANQYVFVMFGGDLIPWIKKMTFPIHKARLTINGVLSSNNEFTVKKNAQGNLSFEGNANRHIGDGATVRETDLNFTISAKKD
ncbi:MAG TPA: hypothetical protein VM935_10325 [Chitinophagaceae bacterium]|nr:hypothetical protein [Chitinophagaceae bacterium]